MAEQRTGGTVHVEGFSASYCAQLPGIIWTTDLQLRLTTMTGDGLRRLHVRPSQVVGLTLAEFFQTEDRNFPPIAAHRRVLEGTACHFEQEWLGHRFSCQVSPLRDPAGATIGCIGVAQDISQCDLGDAALAKSSSVERLADPAPTVDRQLQNEVAQRHRVEAALAERAEQLQRSEEALQEQTRILRSILDSIADGVVAADEHGRMLLVNDAAQLDTYWMQHVSLSEWPKHFGLFTSDRETLFEAEALPLVRAIRGEIVSDVDVFIRNDQIPEGRLLSVSARPLGDLAGGLRGGVAIFRDITVRKYMDEQLLQERQLLRKLLDVQDRERRLIAYDIHDGLVQKMTGSLMHLETLQLGCGGNVERRGGELAQAVRLLQDSVCEARRIISGLRPPVLDELGILAAIEYLVNEARNVIDTVTFKSDTQFERLAQPLESAIFRIVQEALNNVVRHSRAQTAHVELRQRGDQVRLKVQDWGVGFDPQTVSTDRFGLQGIRERARLLGTRATVQSTPGEGTVVTVDFPVLINANQD